MIWSDRHKDITAKPFLDLDKAIDCAKESAKSVCSSGEYWNETPVADCLFHLIYSPESDCIWITEHEIKEEGGIMKVKKTSREKRKFHRVLKRR